MNREIVFGDDAPLDADSERTEKVTVTIELSPFDPGVCSGPVEACYPPEGGELVSFEVVGRDLTLDEAQARQRYGDRVVDEWLEYADDMNREPFDTRELYL